MKQQKILIDGYNLIKTVPVFNEIIEDGLKNARRNLEATLTIYSKDNNISVCVFYDGGTNSYRSQQQNSGLLETFYSKRPEKADDMIMDVIASSHGARWLRVVTSDREIQHFAKRHKISFVGSEEFAEELERPLKPPTTIKEKSREEDPYWCPEKGEIEEWLDVFDSRTSTKSQKTEKNRAQPDLDPNLKLSDKEIDAWDTIFNNQKKNSDSPNDQRS
jgi:predicted RNA-binding protein with PIN domain